MVDSKSVQRSSRDAYFFLETFFFVAFLVVFFATVLRAAFFAALAAIESIDSRVCLVVRWTTQAPLIPPTLGSAAMWSFFVLRGRN